MEGADPAQKDGDVALSLEEQLVNRLDRMCHDMEEAAGYLAALLLIRHKKPSEQPPDSVECALQAAAIVVYARGFVRSDSVNRATAKVALTDFDVSRYPWAPMLHKAVLNARNQAVAHADWTYHNSSLRHASPNFAARVSSSPAYFLGIDLKKFILLASLIKKQCVERVDAYDFKQVR